MHYCAGKKLVIWSLEALQPLLTSGLVSPRNIHLVLLEEHDRTFEISKFVSENYSAGINIIYVENITSGPAETLKHALDRIYKIQGDYPFDFVVADVDHFFISRNMVPKMEEALKSREKSMIVFETSKPKEDLMWCHLVEIDNRKMLVEKPSSENCERLQIDKTRGVIGFYCFVNLDRVAIDEIYAAIDNKKAIYISELINSVSNSNLQGFSVDYFFPMGNPKQLAESHNELSDYLYLPGAQVLFVDLDGTLFVHESGRNGYKNEPELLDETFLNFLKSREDAGDIVIFTTSRTENQTPQLTAFFEYRGMKNFRIVAGLPNGIRYLFNDLKDNSPILTAQSINFKRNHDDLAVIEQLENELRLPQKWREISGGSGLQSYELRLGTTSKFVKMALLNTESSSLLSYQYDWFKFVGALMPDHIPKKVKSFESGSFRYLESEFVDDLQTFGDALMDSSPNNSILLLKDLSKTLLFLHSIRNGDSSDLKALVKVVYSKKVCPVLERLDEMIIETMNRSQLKRLIIQDEEFTFEKFNVENFVAAIKANLEERIHQIPSKTLSHSVIHGDLTLENLSFSKSQGMLLLDPIGARIDPRFSREDGSLGYTSRIFDFARITLSQKWNYDSWKETLKFEQREERGILHFEDSSRHSKLRGMLKEWLTVNEFGGEGLTLEDLELMAYFDLIRILKYKSAKNELGQFFWIVNLLRQEFQRT